MPKFKDSTGREWPIEINVTAIKRVRTLLDVDLMEILGGKLIERMRLDPIFLVDVIYVLCKPEAEKLQISDAAFGEAMAGDAIEGATTALLEAIVGFFPSPRDRANLKLILDATDRAVAKAQDLTEQQIKATDVEALVEAAMPRTPGDSSTTAPESAE